MSGLARRLDTIIKCIIIIIIIIIVIIIIIIIVIVIIIVIIIIIIIIIIIYYKPALVNKQKVVYRFQCDQCGGCLCRLYTKESMNTRARPPSAITCGHVAVTFDRKIQQKRPSGSTKNENQAALSLKATVYPMFFLGKIIFLVL